ncbi:hypothetical protein F4823DRAFT_319686 [Ustulina deusta]|nr:hypothetical protein F4823DRAFT_319686 [Ustulina deusta]
MAHLRGYLHPPLSKFTNCVGKPFLRLTRYCAKPRSLFYLLFHTNPIPRPNHPSITPIHTGTSSQPVSALVVVCLASTSGKSARFRPLTLTRCSCRPTRGTRAQGRVHASLTRQHHPLCVSVSFSKSVTIRDPMSVPMGTVFVPIVLQIRLGTTVPSACRRALLPTPAMVADDEQHRLRSTPAHFLRFHSHSRRRANVSHP